MPKVTINEIDQSRYVVNSQRAPLIALVPVISSWGSTDNAVLIETETDFYNQFGTALKHPINGDITRNYAINLLNSGVSILAKRIKPDSKFNTENKKKPETIDDLYSTLETGAVPEQIVLNGYIDTTDQTYYIPVNSDSEIIGWEHYRADGRKLTLPNYVVATSTTPNALKVVANDTSEDVYDIFDNAEAGTKLIVANDAEDFDETTQIKLEQVTPVYPGKEAEIGKYTKIVSYDPFDDTKEVRLADVTDDIEGAVVDETYVVTILNYIQNSIKAGTFVKTEKDSADRPPLIINGDFKMKLYAKAKYFGSYGDRIGLRISRQISNNTDVLNRDPVDNVIISTYLITKRSSLSQYEDNGGVNPEDGTFNNIDIKSSKLIDTVVLRLDDVNADNSITKFYNFINEFTVLSDFTITDSEGNIPVTREQFVEFVESITSILENKIFMLTKGRDYFEQVTEKDKETGEDIVVVDPTTEPINQFYNTLSEMNENASDSDLNNINDFWNDFKDPYIYDFDFICASGFTNISSFSDSGDIIDENHYLHTNMLKLANVRGDAVACLDAPMDYSHTNMVQYFGSVSNSDVAYSYGTAHGPWCKIRDVVTGNYIIMPPSFIFLATIGNNLSKNSETQIWYAPAGVARASTNLVVEPKYEIGSTILDEWQNDYKIRINPIMRILTYGYTIYGNATLMQDEDGFTKSALQSLGTRVLCNVVKKAIFSVCVALTFEPNDYILWAEFKTRLSTVLEQMKVNGGLADYQIVMDETTVTDEAKNELRVPGKVFISPTRPAEFFDIDFTITQAGVTFDESRSDVIG